LLSQQPCTRNSAGVVLRMETSSLVAAESTVFSGVEHCAALTRQRFDKVLPLRKPPQNVQWPSKTAWAGRR